MYQFILFMSKRLYSELEQNTRALLDSLQQKEGPPIYTLSPARARDVLSGLQSSYSAQKLPADIENLINPDDHNSKEISITYARKLLEAGVRVTAVRYHGTIHDFVMLNAITDDPAPRGAIEQASHMLKKVLST
jgi:acetyl esterase